MSHCIPAQVTGFGRRCSSNREVALLGKTKSFPHTDIVSWKYTMLNESACNKSNKKKYMENKNVILEVCQFFCLGLANMIFFYLIVLCFPLCFQHLKFIFLRYLMLGILIFHCSRTCRLFLFTAITFNSELLPFRYCLSTKMSVIATVFSVNINYHVTYFFTVVYMSRIEGRLLQFIQQ